MAKVHGRQNSKAEIAELAMPEPLDDLSPMDDKYINKMQNSSHITEIIDALQAKSCDQRITLSQKKRLQEIIGTYIDDYKKLHADLILKNKNNPKYNPLVAASIMMKKSGDTQDQAIELDCFPHAVPTTTLDNEANQLNKHLNELAKKFLAKPNADNLASIEIAYQKANLKIYKNYLTRKIEATIILKSLVNTEGHRDEREILEYEQAHPGFALLRRKLGLIGIIESFSGFSGETSRSPRNQLDTYRVEYKKYSSVFNQHCSWAEKSFTAKLLSCISIFVGLYYAVTKAKSAFFTKSLGNKIKLPHMEAEEKNNKRSCRHSL